MTFSELFSLHLDYRSLRVLSGHLSDRVTISRCELLGTAFNATPDTLILASGLQLPKDEDRLCRMLREKTLPPVAAVLVRATTNYDPQPLQAATSEDAPPILAVSISASADDALELVQAALRGQTAYLNHLHTAFQRQCAPLVAENRCPSSILTLLYEYLHVPVFLFSRQYALPERCSCGEFAKPAAAVWRQMLAAQDKPQRIVQDNLLYVFLPVLDSKFSVADLCAVYRADQPPSEADLLLLHSSLPNIAFLMQRSILRRPFFYQLKLPFFHAVLTDMFNGKPELLKQNAEHLGLIFDRPRLLLLVETKPAGSIEDAACRSRIAGYLSSLSQNGHLFRHSGHLLFMTECAAPQKALAKFREEVLPQIQRFSGMGILPELGIGCSACLSSLLEMPEALAEAEFSLHMGAKTKPGTMLHCYEDYMLYYLLSCIKETPAISLIYSEVITVLQDYDRQNNADLLDTLLNLCQNNFNTIQTANQMYLHRNSLYKRVDRISEILDMDLDLPDNLITLHLAARLYELLGRKEAPYETKRFASE